MWIPGIYAVIHNFLGSCSVHVFVCIALILTQILISDFVGCLQDL